MSRDRVAVNEIAEYQDPVEPKRPGHLEQQLPGALIVVRQVCVRDNQRTEECKARCDRPMPAAYGDAGSSPANTATA